MSTEVRYTRSSVCLFTPSRLQGVVRAVFKKSPAPEYFRGEEIGDEEK